MKKLKAADAIADALAGRRIAGGCDDCSAYQTVKQHAPGVYVLGIHHDLACPFYQKAVRRRQPWS